MYSVSQAKYNKLEKELRSGIAALEQENERLKALLSEDLVAENAKLKLKIWEMECAIPKIKAEGITEAVRTIGSHWSSDMGEEVVRIDMLERYADQLEAGK